MGLKKGEGWESTFWNVDGPWRWVVSSSRGVRKSNELESEKEKDCKVESDVDDVVEGLWKERKQVKVEGWRGRLQYTEKQGV